MFSIIITILAGMALGFLLRRRKPGAISRVITVLIWVLLMLLGMEVGSNRMIITRLCTVGAEAVVLAVAATAGSVMAAWLFYRWLIKNNGYVE